MDKSIWGVFITLSLAIILFSGANLVAQEAVLKGNLDTDSLNLIGKYDPMVSSLAVEIENQKNLVEVGIQTEPDSNALSEFYRSFAEGKSKVQTFKDGLNLLYNLPDIMLLSVPFVADEDLTIYKTIIVLMLSVVIFIASWRAIFAADTGGNK